MVNMEYLCIIPSPLGDLTIASDGEYVTGLWTEGSRYYGATLTAAAEEKYLPLFSKVSKWLDTYFSGIEPRNMLPLAPPGTLFRKKVWSILRAIPYGSVTTYGAIAKQLSAGRENYTLAAQAVWGAVGHNPISIIIPCHRVVGANGSLTGYGGGIDKKFQLLQLEKVNMENFFIPTKGTAL